jgi:hypothetical protein
MASRSPTTGSITITASDFFVGRCDRYDVTSEGDTYQGALRKLRAGIRGALNTSRGYHGNVANEVLIITTSTRTSTNVTTSMLNNDGM